MLFLGKLALVFFTLFAEIIINPIFDDSNCMSFLNILQFQNYSPYLLSYQWRPHQVKQIFKIITLL
jgi:hypothetical protein